MRLRSRALKWFSMVLLALGLSGGSGCRQSNGVGEAPSSPRGEESEKAVSKVEDPEPAATPIPVPPPAPVHDWQTDDIRPEFKEILRAFPKSELVLAGYGKVGGTRFINRDFSEVIDRIAAESRGKEVQILFIVDDWAGPDVGPAFAWAMAEHRSRLPPGEYGLLIVDDGRTQPLAEVAVPFTTDSYAVLLAAARDYEGGYVTDVAINTTWLALDKARSLAWRDESVKHVVLVTDDRDHMSMSGPPFGRDARVKKMRPDASLPSVLETVPKMVESWAHDESLSFHVLRCAMLDRDGLVPLELIEFNSGIPPEVVAGLFRKGEAVEVLTAEALQALLFENLGQGEKTTAQAVDVALLVDGRVGMKHALKELRKMGSLFEQFLAVENHRLAVVRFDKLSNRARRLVDFTSSSERVVKALRSIRTRLKALSPSGVFGALGVARDLSWRPNAQRRILILTERGLGGWHHEDIVRWIEDEGAAVTLVSIRPSQWATTE